MKIDFIDFCLLCLMMLGCSIVIGIHIEKSAEQSENRIIEAIQKKNDSINSVKYLNREKPIKN